VLLFLFAVVVISFFEKKRNKIFACYGTVHYDNSTVQNRFLMELGIGLLFPKGK